MIKLNSDCQVSMMKKLFQKTAISISIILVVSLMVPPFFANTPTVSASPATIFKIQSGLVTSDSLTTGNVSYWSNNGSAADPAINAPHSQSEDSSGYHIGVVTPSAGKWAGWFAVSPLTSATLFHVTVKLPDAKPITGLLDTALYVQQEMNQDPRIDAMGCGADTSPTKTYWDISLQAGDANNELVAQKVYTDDSPNQPTTRECTFVTNGNNQLTAYIDGQKVFSSNKMNLNMPKPFQSYLETQTNSNTPSTGSNFTGTFTDYYETTSANVTVRDAGAGSIVKIVNATSGGTLASSTADSNGTALIDVGRYHMPINATVQVFDGAGVNLLATTSSPGIYGGDIYDVGTSAVPTTVMTVKAVDMSGIESSPHLYTTINNGTTTRDGYTPVIFNGFQDKLYTISVDNFGRFTFDHWDDDTRIGDRVFTPTTSAVTLTAYFRNSTLPDPPVSLTSLTQYTTNVVTPTILGTATPNYSVQLFDGVTPIASPVTVSSNGTWSITTPSLSEGNHMLSATTTNGSSTSTPSTPLTMTIDTTNPSISITGNPQSNRQVTLTGTSNDIGSGIKLVEVSIDNSANYTQVKTNAPADWSVWSFTTGQLSIGTHQFTVRATDMALNQNTNIVGFQVTNPATPLILLNPSSGIVGSTVTISGNNFAPSSTISIKFNGVIQTTNPTTMTTNFTGGFTGSIIVPSSSTGPFPINAIDASTNTASSQFTVIHPVINTAVPASGPVGQTVSVNFNNLIANSSSTIKFGTKSVSNSTVNTNSTGGWKGTVTVPSGSGNNINVSDGTNTLSTPFTVTTPSIKAASPTSGPVGQTVSVSFNNLFTNTPYTIKFGSTTANGAFATGTTNSTGGAQGLVIVPSIPVGSQSLSVSDGTNTLSTPFTVTKTPTTTLLELNPNPSAPGQVVTFKANVTSTGNPTGMVTFLNGTQILGTNTTSSGIAKFSTSVLSKGSYNISSQYSGDSNFAPSTSLVLIQKVYPLCIPPNSGDWIILQSCILALNSHAIVLGNVIVQNGAVLTIPNNASLKIDFAHKHLIVKSGGGVLIKAGGAIN